MEPVNQPSIDQKPIESEPDLKNFRKIRFFIVFAILIVIELILFGGLSGGAFGPSGGGPLLLVYALGALAGSWLATRSLKPRSATWKEVLEIIVVSIFALIIAAVIGFGLCTAAFFSGAIR